MTRALILTFSAAGALAMLVACSGHEQQVSANTGKNPPIVKTVRVEQREISSELSIPARVVPDPAAVVRVYPPASGRLLRVSVRPGDRVSKGQPLAVLESGDIAQARSDYDKASAEADKNQRALDRAKLLYEHHAIAARELEDQQAAAAEARSELARAAGRLRVLGAPLQGDSTDVSVLAPRSGSVIALGAAGGELSKSVDNADPICTIADLASVWIVGDVYEKDLASVHVGDTVSITLNAYRDRKWTGRVAAISDTVDPQSRTLKLRVVLPNPERLLKPEMFATIHVQKPASPALVIPASALLREGGDTSVMVESKPGVYERRLVHLQSSNGKEAVVASGLSAGETVVTEGAALVRGGGDQQ